MARPVIGIDFGHGETAVYIRIGSRIFPMRLDAAGSLKMITALALIQSADEKQFVLFGNALRGYETLRRLQEADVQAVSGADFRALLLEYTTILAHHAEDKAHIALYIPCAAEELRDDVRQALLSAVDACKPAETGFYLEQGTYFSPLYQTFKAPPSLKQKDFCAVTWDDICNDDGICQPTMRELMALFLNSLAYRLINYNTEEWAETRQEGVDVHIGVPALKEWLDPAALAQYAEMVHTAMQPWISTPDSPPLVKEPENNIYLPQDETALPEHVSIYPEPCAALMSYFREYPEGKLQSGISVSDHGSCSLDFCCIAIREEASRSALCRITGSTDRCGGRMVEDGMLRRLTDKEGLSLLRDITRSESSALRLQLRLIKEAYYTAPDAMGNLPQKLRIHLKDGSVRTVDFTSRELVRSVVQPGTPWHNAVSSFADNMSAAVMNQGVVSSNLFLTGGTANVTETQEIFAAAGMGDCRMSGDTSASVADGLCRLITRSEIGEMKASIAFEMSNLGSLSNEARNVLSSALQNALIAELPALVTDATQKFMQKTHAPSLRHFSSDVESRLVRNKPLMDALHNAVLSYAQTRGQQIVPVITKLAQERFPGRLPENPQMTLDCSHLIPNAGKIIVRHFVQHLNFRGMLGGLLHGLLSFFGLGEKNPKLDKAALERIGQIMRSSSVPAKIHNAVNQALAATQLCIQTDALVLDALIGYLTLTRFDTEITL